MGCGISKIDPEEAGTKFNRLPVRNVDSHDIAPQQLSINREDDKEGLDDLSTTNRNDRKSVSSYKGEPIHQVQEVKARNSAANRININDNSERRSVSSSVGNKGEPDHQYQAQEVNAKKAAAVYNCREGSGVGNGRNYNKEIAAKDRTAEEENVSHRKHGHEEDEESDNERDDSIARPGSPSFREYCAGESKNEGRIRAKGENNKSQAEGSPVSDRPGETEKKKKSIGKGIRNAMHRPAGWIYRQK